MFHFTGFHRTGLRGLALVLSGAVVAAPPLRADEKDKDRGGSDNRATVTRRLDESKDWIGVLPQPIDDAMKSQLGLGDRLIVHHVLPDTPAAKAGLKSHDILLKFGDRDISTAEDLIEAMAAGGGKEMTLLVLRHGKKLTLHVQPTKRPLELELKSLLPKIDDEDFREFLGQLKGEMDDDRFVWKLVGPGIVPPMFAGQHKPFPDGLSITVAKENDQPARITARQDGKTYETTADRLDVLPKDIRPFVERLLHGGSDLVWGFSRSDMPRPGQLSGKGPGDAAKMFRHHVEIRKADSETLGELRKELDSLKKEVEKLKSRGESDSDNKQD